MTRTLLSVATVLAVLYTLWIALVPVMNIKWEVSQAQRAGAEVWIPESGIRTAGNWQVLAGNLSLIPGTYAQEKPRLPSPGQVFAELWDTTAGKKITSKRSLIYHAQVTLSATLLGFGMGTVLGMLLAIGIVHVRALDASVMPWAIASQTIPILAIAPMIIVVMNSVGITGLVPKAIISAYLSFFPVVVGMVKGLRSPDAMQMDLLRTYSASPTQTFWKLRLPAALPFLFPSLKIGIAAALVGAIVGELPTGAVAGLGARLLAGSYYGQTIQIWSALFGAAIVAALLVGLIGLIQNLLLKHMGLAR
ncbi:MAG: ABC transporter permease [Pseudomonadota bacterium]